MTLIDGIGMEQPGFALTVSDALPEDMLDERISAITTLSGMCPELRFVCIRDDAMDAELFSNAASKARACGLGLILESMVLDNLGIAARSLPDRRPLLLSAESDQHSLIALATRLGLPVMVTSNDVDELLGLSADAEYDGCVDVILNPAVTDMKQCLESTVAIRRRYEPGNPADRPIGIRVWSGEYALGMSSVMFLRGGMLSILDDLDPIMCGVLDSLISNFS